MDVTELNVASNIGFRSVFGQGMGQHDWSDGDFYIIFGFWQIFCESKETAEMENLFW